MSSSQSGVMTPDQYLQTDEQTLIEIAPHWRLLQVFPREPRRIGYNCGAMFYIGTERDDKPGTGEPDMASLLYGGPCLEETALALSALIPLMPGAKLVVMMVRNTKSQEGHDKEVIWRACKSHDPILIMRNIDNLDSLMEPVMLRPKDRVLGNSQPYFVIPHAISNKRGMKQVDVGFYTHNPYGTAIELLLRGYDVGAIVRVMKWGEKKFVYRRNQFIKFASTNFPAKPMRETVHDVRARQYSESSLVGGYGEW